MSTQVGAIPSYNYYNPYMTYNPTVGAYGYDYSNFYQFDPSSYAGNCPWMSMNDSIYGYTGGFPMPFTGGGTIDYSKMYENMYQNMDRQQEYYNNYAVRQRQNYRNQEAQVNAPMRLVKESVSDLQDKIKDKDPDQIMSAYNALAQNVASTYGLEDPEVIKAQTMEEYRAMTGKDLKDELRENMNNPFVQGFLNASTMGRYENYSSEDLISQITGQPVSTKNKDAQDGGKFLGSAIPGTALGGIGYWLSNFSSKDGAKMIAEATRTSDTALFKQGKKLAKAGKYGKIISVLAGLAATAFALYETNKK